MANPSAARRAPLTPERIDAAALALVDQGGMRALSMRRLGAALGVDPMAVYHHVPGKQALFHRLVRAVFADMPVPAGDRPWDDRVRAWALAYRDVVAAHPALVLTIVTDQEAVAVATEAATAELHAALAEAGLSPADAELCADVVVDHVNGAVLACAPGPDGDPPGPGLGAHLAAAYVVVDHVNGAVLACAPGPDGDPPGPGLGAHLAAAYAAGLEVVLDGIRSRATRGTSGSAPTR